MKIGIITSSNNIILPQSTGGVESEVFCLARELADRKHDITLFAGPGSEVSGVRIKPIGPELAVAEMSYANLKERVVGFNDRLFLAEFFADNEHQNFDILHYNNYLYYEILPFIRNSQIPVLIRINYPHTEIHPYIIESISGQSGIKYLPASGFIKELMSGLEYTEPVYPAIDFGEYELSAEKGEYLLFIGRICPEKGTHLAIRAAKNLGQNLVIAGKVSQANREYFDREIKPHIDNDKITYVGVVDNELKKRIYSKATVTLFPIQWDEPFGLVIIESMATGTPVVAINRAAVGEVIKNGVNGYIVDCDEDNGFAEAIGKATKLDRKGVRQSVEEKFSVQKQADVYEKICKRIINKAKC